MRPQVRLALERPRGALDATGLISKLPGISEQEVVTANTQFSSEYKAAPASRGVYKWVSMQVSMTPVVRHLES